MSTGGIHSSEHTYIASCVAQNDLWGMYLIDIAELLEVLRKDRVIHVQVIRPFHMVIARSPGTLNMVPLYEVDITL
jgi:hypothetical protein